MDKIINVGLLKHPFNWIIVYLMVLFGALAVRLLFPAPVKPSGVDPT